VDPQNTDPLDTKHPENLHLEDTVQTHASRHTSPAIIAIAIAIADRPPCSSPPPRALLLRLHCGVHTAAVRVHGRFLYTLGPGHFHRGGHASSRMC
jgi:hypothetical protein